MVDGGVRPLTTPDGTHYDTFAFGPGMSFEVGEALASGMGFYVSLLVRTDAGAYAVAVHLVAS